MLQYDEQRPIAALPGLDAELADDLAFRLNRDLATLADLAAAYKQAHWNVLGPGLTELHPLFERFAEQTRAYVDLVAERAVSLGGAACSALTSFPIDERDGRALLQELSRRVERTAEELRRAIRSSAEDPVTQDCYIEIARGIEKQRWMLLAHLKDRDESPGRHA